MTKIAVCVKQVPDLAELKFEKDRPTVVAKEVPRKISDFDKNALEEAVRIKEKQGGEVTAITIGPPEARDALKEALAIGADKAVLLNDPAFERLDSIMTASVLSSAIKKLEGFDIILCGEASIDGYSAQVGPSLAEWLGIPQITYAKGVKVEGGKVVVERSLEDIIEVVEAKTPLLITVVREINEPRYPSLMMIKKAGKKEIAEFNAAALGLDPEPLKTSGFRLQILRAEAPSMERKKVIFEGDAAEAVQKLVQTLQADKVVGG